MRELAFAAIGAVVLIAIGVWAASASSGANAGPVSGSSIELRQPQSAN